MSSIIEGYNYDIFISYRQKDNKGGKWVSEFVEALKIELESTFKEDVSIYFDENPNDGLLETYSVEKSLEDKLRCLIFIPIISQTYCDQKSFAWQHEFCAFNKLAKEDQYGRDIRLASNNVTSRVLPVKIHELDAEDKNLLENEIAGVLRPIEFIYRESGVNRPLTSEDDENKNLNKTKYRNQINKVANAIKEILTSLKRQGLHPEEAVKKEPKSKPAVKGYNKSRIVAEVLLSLVLIVLGFILIPKFFISTDQPEKSIAVLPFRNESPGAENSAFINGLMEKLLNNLQMIEDLRVISRTSTEQYRDQKKSIHDIAKELGVNYIVEGSGQKFGNTFSLSVQLIRADKKEDHVWGKSFEQEIKEVSDILTIQSRIAEAIANELKANITTEEKHLINKIPTYNLTAYDFYERGIYENTKYWDNENQAALVKAEELYYEALKYDSTFAKAYVGLANVYWDKHYSNEYFSDNYLDSVLIFCERALSYDDQLFEAYNLKGNYYNSVGKPEKSMQAFDKAIELNPNDWTAYYMISVLYGWDDFVKAISNLHKAASLNRGIELHGILRELGSAYLSSGFIEKYSYYWMEAFKLDGDSASYYQALASIESYHGDYEKANDFLLKAYALDTTNLWIFKDLGANYSYMGKYEQSLNCYKRLIEGSDSNTVLGLWDLHRLAFAYWKNGYKKEADYYFDKMIEYCNNENKLERVRSKQFFTYYDLAGVYAFKGEKAEAYKNLRMFNQRKSEPYWIVDLINHDQLFNGIRNETEFKQIVKDTEAKYQAEHERVRKWLEDHGELTKEKLPGN